MIEIGRCFDEFAIHAAPVDCSGCKYLYSHSAPACQDGGQAFSPADASIASTPLAL
jgi:hypothetical protein